MTDNRIESLEKVVEFLAKVVDDLTARVDALEHPHPALADPDSCKDGFCPVDLFRPIDETEGSV